MSHSLQYFKIIYLLALILISIIIKLTINVICDIFLVLVYDCISSPTNRIDVQFIELKKYTFKFT